MAMKAEMREYLDLLVSKGAPAVYEAPISVIRKNAQGRRAFMGEPEPIHEVLHRFIAGPTADLPIRIYRPHPQVKLPVMVWFHGGGFALNYLDLYEQALRSLANKGQFIIVAVNYQKSPEHPFPVPFDDCFATLQWVVDNAEEFGFDLSGVGVGGDSAGANLAAAVALKARDTQLIDLAFQLLIYPCNDLTMNYESARVNGEGYGLTTKTMEWFIDKYIPKKSELKNPYASPAYAKDHSHLAPAITITAEFDPLLDDGYNYNVALRKAGNTTIYREFAGQIHGFFIQAGVTEDAEIAQEFVANEINALLKR